jgi:signal transduction histidine kinase
MRSVASTFVRRSPFVYALLALVWAVIAGWQAVEHDRVRQAARASLINRSRDITTTLGLVIRSQRRFREGLVSQERLESALKELVKSGELSSVALLNAAGEVVASGGAPIDLDTRGVMQTGERWDARTVTLVNPVDLGANVAREGETNRPTIVLPRREPGTAGGPGPGGPPEDRERPRFPGPTNDVPPPPPLWAGPEGSTNSPPPGFTNAAGPNRSDRRNWRPFRMDEKEYQELLERRGLHGLVVAMSTATFNKTCRQDLWQRCLVGSFAAVSALGLGLAWRNVGKFSELQMRLLRASELNTHLRQMNLAAAGLAHETRNPLNIIRGLAHIISRQEDAPEGVRRRSSEIIDEADRVTGQLNEFINFSRPREVRRAPVALRHVLGEVVRALGYDLEEKQIQLTVMETDLSIEADEQLLRQALFNLLLNATQAVEPKGEIEIVADRLSPTEAFLEIRDNGPGVAPEHREDIFKPYFTTHQKGTGLGLAVVQQIVLAHSWEIECLPRAPRGAVFRLTHLGLAPRTA